MPSTKQESFFWILYIIKYIVEAMVHFFLCYVKYSKNCGEVFTIFYYIYKHFSFCCHLQYLAQFKMKNDRESEEREGRWNIELW